jgi:hypothetical protein
MTEGKSDRIAVNCKLLRETEKAWMITDDGDREIWIPKSQGEIYKRVDDTWDLFAEEWLLKAKGLI